MRIDWLAAPVTVDTGETARNKMVSSCCVPGCTNRYSKNASLEFYRIPQDPHLRAAWTGAIFNDDKREHYRNYDRICGAHFLSGMKSSDPAHPDYIPSIFPHTSAENLRLLKQKYETFRLEHDKELLKLNTELSALNHLWQEKGWSKDSIQKLLTENTAVPAPPATASIVPPIVSPGSLGPEVTCVYQPEQYLILDKGQGLGKMVVRLTYPFKSDALSTNLRTDINVTADMSLGTDTKLRTDKTDHAQCYSDSSRDRAKVDSFKSIPSTSRRKVKFQSTQVDSFMDISKDLNDKEIEAIREMVKLDTERQKSPEFSEDNTTCESVQDEIDNNAMCNKERQGSTTEPFTTSSVMPHETKGENKISLSKSGGCSTFDSLETLHHSEIRNNFDAADTNSESNCGKICDKVVVSANVEIKENIGELKLFSTRNKKGDNDKNASEKIVSQDNMSTEGHTRGKFETENSESQTRSPLIDCAAVACKLKSGNIIEKEKIDQSESSNKSGKEDETTDSADESIRQKQTVKKPYVSNTDFQMNIPPRSNVSCSEDSTSSRECLHKNNDEPKFDNQACGVSSEWAVNSSSKERSCPVGKQPKDQIDNSEKQDSQSTLTLDHPYHETNGSGDIRVKVSKMYSPSSSCFDSHKTGSVDVVRRHFKYDETVQIGYHGYDVLSRVADSNESGTQTEPDDDHRLQLHVETERLTLLEELLDLQSKVSKRLYTISAFIDNPEKVKFYTGFANFQTMKTVFDFVVPHYPKTQSTIPLFEQFTLTMIKLRLGLRMRDLGHQVNLSSARISETVTNWFDTLYCCLTPLVDWPKGKKLTLRFYQGKIELLKRRYFILEHIYDNLKTSDNWIFGKGVKDTVRVCDVLSQFYVPGPDDPKDSSPESMDPFQIPEPLTEDESSSSSSEEEEVEREIVPEVTSVYKPPLKRRRKATESDVPISEDSQDIQPMLDATVCDGNLINNTLIDSGLGDTSLVTNAFSNYPGIDCGLSGSYNSMDTALIKQLGLDSVSSNSRPGDSVFSNQAPLSNMESLFGVSSCGDSASDSAGTNSQTESASSVQVNTLDETISLLASRLKSNKKETKRTYRRSYGKFSARKTSTVTQQGSTPVSRALVDHIYIRSDPPPGFLSTESSSSFNTCPESVITDHSYCTNPNMTSQGVSDNTISSSGDEVMLDLETSSHLESDQDISSVSKNVSVARYQTHGFNCGNTTGNAGGSVLADMDDATALGSDVNNSDDWSLEDLSQQESCLTAPCVDLTDAITDSQGQVFVMVENSKGNKVDKKC